MTRSWILVLAPLLYPCVAGADVVEPPQQRIANYLTSLKDSGYGYSVLVSLEGKVLIEEAYGWSDTSGKCRTSTRTVFNVASIAKSFTAIAVFQLRNQGKVRLEDPLTTFFEHVPADKQSITVQQLLTHTSGFAQNYVADGKKSRDEAVRAILSDTLEFPPGSGFSYSNENFELLAAIIEVAGGTSYEKYVGKQILKRANMTGTRFWHEADPRRGCAVAAVNENFDAVPGIRNWGHVGSGGFYTTVTDLYRWFTALIDGRLLEPADLERMWTPQWNASTTRIAYGWFVSETGGTSEVWTRGTESWGHNAVLRWFPERELLVIVETNSGELGDKSTTANRIISDEIVRILLALEPA